MPHMLMTARKANAIAFGRARTFAIFVKEVSRDEAFAQAGGGALFVKVAKRIGSWHIAWLAPAISFATTKC